MAPPAARSHASKKFTTIESLLIHIFYNIDPHPLQRCTSKFICCILYFNACDGVNIQLFCLQRGSFSSVVDVSHLY